MVTKEKTPSKSRAVKAGSTLGVIALSAPCEAERLERGLKFIESLGYKTKVALEPAREYGKTTHLFSSDSPQNRGRAFNEFLADSEVKAIISARGAFGSMEALPYIDFALWKKNPKMLIGFSDTTACLAAGYQNADVFTVHGPSVESAFSKAHENTLARRTAETALDFIGGLLMNPFQDLTLQRICGDGDGTGRLIGGNLSMLSSLMGTAWEPNLKNHILFLEEVSEKPYRVHRMLLQMKLAGKFEKVSGVLLGSFRDCEHPKAVGPTLHDVFLNIFGDLRVPVLGFAPFGHEDLNLPVPLGVLARISHDKLELLESPVLL